MTSSSPFSSPRPAALVTGASGGIGQAIAMALAESGYHVWLHAHHNPARAQALADALCEQGHLASVVQFDVCDRAQVDAALAPILEQHRLQVLVNNAGIHDDAVFPGMAPAQWHSVIDVSLHGFFNVTQAVSMHMIRAKKGRVISISSVAALAGNRGQTNYAAAKAALHGASKSLALELASRGITVNVVAPGIIDSGMADGLFSPEVIKTMVPMKRAGTAKEVASLVAYLASDDAAYLSGQVISVNGAMYS